MKVYIKTYGCQMNERDSEALAGMLIRAGHEIAQTEEEADVLLFNTCSVREQAERKAIGKIGYMKKLKAHKPELIIGAIGCMAQRKGEELLRELPHLDFVLGTGQLHKLVETVEALRRQRKQLALTAESDDVLTEMGTHHTPAGSPGWHGQIAITRGCNRFCSYCIVPYVRGREISREQSDVVAEATALAAAGVKEIMLLGQNVAAYGLNGDTNPPPDDHSPFADLLEALNAVSGLLRIRFTSPYVSYFNRRLIEAMAKSTKICHNLHLPLQSGSDRILKAMNRQYTRESYLQKVADLKAAMPDITFSTDVIVGFPGETGEDFDQTREVMNFVNFDNAFIFKYSPRPGAKSASMSDDISQEVKEERNQILLADLKSRVEHNLDHLINTVQEVLVEGVSPRNAERFTGRTVHNRVVHFEPDATLQPGTLRQVKITRINAVSLFGELLPEQGR